MALIGPTDVTGAFIEGDLLTLVDGRVNIWIYNTSITEDADGNEIVAPSSVDTVIVAPNRERLIVVSGGTYWTYSLTHGAWREGLSCTELLPGEEEKTFDPWKRGHNVETPPQPDEAVPARKRKREAA